MSTEQELREDLDRATNALERADRTRQQQEAAILDLEARLVRSGQELATWKDAAIARTKERDNKDAALFRTDNLLTSTIADRDRIKHDLEQALLARETAKSAGAAAELDALVGVLEAQLKMWRASGIAAERKAGAVEALADVLGMIRRRRAGQST